MQLQFKSVASSEITKILRNEHVFIFYNKNNIYSFISCFLLYRFFEQSEQLQNINLIPVSKPEDMIINRFKLFEELKKGSVIFLDCPVRKETIGFYIKVAKRIIVVDDQESSYKTTLHSIANSSYSRENKKKVTFTHTKGFCSPCTVWTLLTNEEAIPELLKLQNLYNRDKRNLALSDYDLVVPTLAGHNFNDVEDFLMNKISKLDFFLKSYSTLNYVLQNVYNNCTSNSFILKIKNLNAICINLSKEEDRVLNYLKKISSDKFECDLIVTFVQLEKGVSIILTTENDKLNLLEIFDKYNPVGNKNKIEIYSKKSFLETFK